MFLMKKKGNERGNKVGNKNGFCYPWTALFEGVRGRKSGKCLKN